MTKKIYDLAVKTGEYQKDGQTKGKYQNVGAILQKEDGGKFILLEKWFNPAGVVDSKDNSSVIISMFPQKQHDGQSGAANQNSAPEQQPKNDEDFPF